MNRVLAIWLTSGVFFSLTSLTFAAGPDPIPLWPNGAPGALGKEATDIPQLRIYPADPAIATGACVVVLPGGGYGHLATDHEGHQVATWLNSIGVTSAVVSYRLGPKYHHPAPLEDAQRGLRYMRANAAELKIDPQRVGIMGFSAGGHLASTVSTHFDAGDKASSDPVAQQSSRPDFAILAYPVISLKSSFAHAGSRKNLLGDNPDPALVESLSNETQVTKDTPPTFIFHTAEDKGVPVDNAIVYYQALQKNGVPAEMHIYQKGPHGVGLAPKDPVLNTWKERLADWMKVNGFLAKVERAPMKGTINLHGKPLRWGSVTFTPVKNDHAPATCAMVAHGKFAVDRASGPVVGLNEIVVCNLGDVVPWPTIEEFEVAAEPQLTFDVRPEQNEVALDLK
ncbi:alpha/beta hydrolase [Planctomicrobium piriforme]|uniref:Acetyl esterase/lipase n=1 Tax=Planctomicrobium piriforme TaxID=1576369 RepID=A0A1I3GLH9_9PLAN|nr:alpha/beta hydrolase [Planctomicrobium piriforme]SFI24345.1 Acetyl esterase/lipase [Planctomicrobium piriforme]